MPYMLMIIEDPKQRSTRTLEEGKEAYAQMLRWTDTLIARGLRKASDALKSHSEATRVQLRGGKRLVVDGPFAECKEMVGGFFLLDCPTKEEAIAIAAECPAAEWATVEIREIGRCWE
jgi:hypothetical protein